MCSVSVSDSDEDVSEESSSDSLDTSSSLHALSDLTRMYPRNLLPIRWIPRVQCLQELLRALQEPILLEE